MKSPSSIRVSLVLYCTTLLALALASVSVLGYRTAMGGLESRRAAARQLHETQFFDRCRDCEETMDNELLGQAQTLARLVQFQLDFRRLRNREITLIGLISIPQNSYFSAPIWLAGVGRGPVAMELFRRNTVEVRLDPAELLRQGEDNIAEYYQIKTSWGASNLSTSLNGVPLDQDLQRFAPNQALYWEFDQTNHSSGKLVRRVRLKTSAQSLVPFRPARRPGPENQASNNRGDRTEPRSERMDRGDAMRSSLYIECAQDYSRYEAKMDEFRVRRDEELLQTDTEVDQALASLRRELTLVGALGFLAATIGLLAILRVGLRPLARLSEAVSLITPKDFQLKIDHSQLPKELKPIALRLEETLKQLGRAFDREKQATADISHELRTPLAAMLTTCELALRKSRSTEEYREFLTDCQGAGLQMNRAVERLLTLARLDAGVDAFRAALVDINQIATDCVNQVRNLADSSGIQLELDTSGIAKVSTDSDKLSEVLLNLLHNAIQYNKSGGTVTLRTRQLDDHAEISVIDTGIGIPAEYRERIFERFFRMDPSRTSDGMNSGLGLSIVKGFVELMGGAIMVESAPGAGSIFRLILPLAPERKLKSVPVI
jgi:signal transduction histidine kinase